LNGKQEFGLFFNKKANFLLFLSFLEWWRGGYFVFGVK